MKPKIGISLSLDENRETSLLPGVSLVYLNDEPIRAIEQAGGIPILLPSIQGSTLFEELMDGLDGLLMTGGLRALPPQLARRTPLPDLKEQNPARYLYDLRLLEGALSRSMPILGICRGMQMLNEVTGGSLQRQVPDPRYHRTPKGGVETRHPILVKKDTILHDIVSADQLVVNSYHVQAVLETGPFMQVSAYAEDGVAEAIESKPNQKGIPNQFNLGVQFHPEKMLKTSAGLRIFESFVMAARSFKTKTRA